MSEYHESLSIGQRIRLMREMRRYKQTELAQKIGLGQAAISNLETDSSRKPSAPTLLKLAAALECSPQWLLDGKGKPDAWRPVTKAAEVELLETYRAMTPEARAALLAAARAMK